MSTSEQRNRVGTLEAGLDIIERLAERATPAGVTELAAELDMDKGNLHRLLKVLANRGWVSQHAETRRYTLTPHVVGLAGSMLRKLDLRLAAEDVCARLLEQTNESIHLSTLTATGPVYILQRRPPSRVSVATEVGARPPLHATATGKVILAFVDEARRREWLVEPFETYTLRTHTSWDSLERDLQTIRTRGFAIDDEEFDPGARCAAAPIFGLDGDVIGCVGASTPTQRVSIGDMTKLADAVLAAARDITHRMGGPTEKHPGGATWVDDGGSAPA